MKLQELTESFTVESDKQSNLSSKLTDIKKLIQELRKEIKVTNNNYIHTCIGTYCILNSLTEGISFIINFTVKYFSGCMTSLE